MPKISELSKEQKAEILNLYETTLTPTNELRACLVSIQ